ncbi:MAG: PEFG-CTERM sorting domain-containing protein [Nitrosopumilus sp.]|nr:PEFG-CTERM sorting domain-containing protein [Nitrosopumilus sp.]
MRKLIWIMFAALMIIIPLQSIAFAESTYDINIPSGSADKDSPFHWSSEKDGDTSGFIEIIVNDTVFWKNGDTVTHTVTSGTPLNGPDGIFDSGKMGPGKFFVQKFTQVGEFPYYCTLHPWRTGLVTVVTGHSYLPNVGSDFGDGANVFDLEYKFNRLVDRASIDESTKSISFELKGNTINDDNTLTLFLPSTLISGISSVSIDGAMTVEFTQEFEDEITVLVINEVPSDAKSVTITGTTIVPEFGTITAMILAVATISIIAISARSRLNIMPRI